MLKEDDSIVRSLYREKSKFILQVTHELRSPIAVIRGFHEMILKGAAGKITNRLKKLITRADHRVGNLLIIIDELIDYASLNSKLIAAKKTDLDLEKIMEEVRVYFKEPAGSKKISLNISCSSGLRIRAEKDLILILMNCLIANAIQYSPEKSTVAVKVWKKDSHIKIRITDQGIGISKKEISRVFEEFYRTRRAREMEKDGTGLGLPIARKAVRLLNGSLEVHSRLNRGTRFQILLPIQNRSSLKGGIKN